MLVAGHNPKRQAARWLALAISSLLVAGSFSLLLVIARVPPFSALVTDAQFFKRCLVVHVDLALVVWFYAFLAGLYSLLDAKGTSPGRGALGFGAAALGVAALPLTLFVPGVKPVLANYVPALDHPLFLAGLALFFVGLVLTFADARLLPSREVEGAPGPVPPEARPALRAAALAVLFAVLTVAASFTSMPAGLPAEGRYELLFWGGGHVLQVASEAAMLGVWLMLLVPALGRSPVSRRASLALTSLLLLPAAAGPPLALQGVQNGWVHGAFTQGMRWGIFGPVLVFLALCVRGVWRARREVQLGNPRLLAFYASAALTVAGFCLGALITGSNTMVPAHYHANIGAVTAAFMGVTVPLLATLGCEWPGARLQRAVRWQPAIFGSGQLVFALGFALAGASGMARKTYGAEQHIRTAQEWAGLVVMGAGGLVAVAGGLLFLTYVVRAFGPARRLSVFAALTRRRTWPKPVESTPSRR